MPALSKKQQKFMGIVRSIQKGEQPASKFNKDAQDVAKDMKKKDVKKFASTKHKGLPMKKEMFSKINKMIKQELKEYTYGVGDVVKDVNPSCPHYGAEGKVKSVSPRSVVFIVTNKGDNFKPGQELEKTHDQMKKTNEALSPKAKPLARGLSKSQKDTLEMMIDMQGLDQVMSDFKRDKKAFKQALADMSENINEDGHTDVASAKRKAMLVVDDANKLLNKLNGMNKEDSLPSWLSDKITIAQTNLSKSSDYLNNPVESVNEFRDKREADTARDQIGNKALYMIGAKDFVFGTSGGKKSLVFKIMRNSKGVSHIRMRLSSMDLYDMEFLAIRAGKVKVKSKEKGVYGDQLGVMIKKNTGLNIRL